MEKIICLYCKKEFFRYPSRHRKYCSHQCSTNDNFGRHSQLRNCIFCGKEFRKDNWYIKNGGGKYCSYKCRSKYERSIRPKIKCQTCGKIFQVHKSISLTAKYCSKKCDGKGRSKFYIGKNGPYWKGGKIISSYGYIFIWKPKHPFVAKRGYIFEHRLVIEKQIGRYLLPKEKSHHLNGIKTDNRPENLMAFTSESAHQRFHHNPNNVKPSEIIFDGRKLIKVI